MKQRYTSLAILGALDMGTSTAANMKFLTGGNNQGNGDIK